MPTEKTRKRGAKPLRRGAKAKAPQVQPCFVPFMTVGVGIAAIPPINPAILNAVKALAINDCIARAIAICRPNPQCPNASFVMKLADFAFFFGFLLIHIVVARWVCVPANPVPFPRGRGYKVRP